MPVPNADSSGVTIKGTNSVTGTSSSPHTSGNVLAVAMSSGIRMHEIDGLRTDDHLT